MTSRGEQGAMSLLAAAVVGVVLLGALLGMDAVRLSASKVTAQTAADAAALAAAPQTFDPFGTGQSPLKAATMMAEANDARLTTCRCPTDLAWRARIVEVTVEIVVPTGPLGVSTVTASAVAEFDPTVWLEP